MAIRVGVNGFGRIGRQVVRALREQNVADVTVVAVNDLTDTKTLAHLFKYDSVHGIYEGDVSAGDGAIVVDGDEIVVLVEKDPAALPWKKLGVDIVLESTGRFTKAADAGKHIAGGARKVVISAPASGEDLTIVLGVNEKKYDPAKHNIISNASCTTNCVAPMVKIVRDAVGFRHGSMTTIHSYTNDQNVLDFPHKDLRRARAAALNIIPSSTGAAKAIGLVVPELKGKLDGYAMRLPTPNVSVVDVVAVLKKPTTTEEVNSALQGAAGNSLSGILEYTEEPLVSSDLLHNSSSSIVDGQLTKVIGGNLAKVVSWYDNEWGYSNRIVDLIAFLGEKGL